jgi:hypothetical protein
VEQLVHTEIWISTPKLPHVDPLGSTGLGGRLNSFQRSTQLSSNGPKELRLGWQIGVTPLRSKIMVRVIWGAEFALRAAPRAKHCFEVVGLASGGSVG